MANSEEANKVTESVSFLAKEGNVQNSRNEAMNEIRKKYERKRCKVNERNIKSKKE